MPDIDITTAAPLSLTGLLINLGIGLVISLALSWHFRRFGSTLSNRVEFAQVFPFIVLTTILIISVVKSSLALSLGLVGALSIVRFRTPIKEPEELAYLFVGIAVGLGLGADQRIPTIVAAAVILGALALLRVRSTTSTTRNLYLALDWKTDAAGEPKLASFTNIVSEHAEANDLRRVDERDQLVEATYYVDLRDADRLSNLLDALRSHHTGVGISLIDQNNMPSV